MEVSELDAIESPRRRAAFRLGLAASRALAGAAGLVCIGCGGFVLWAAARELGGDSPLGAGDLAFAAGLGLLAVLLGAAMIRDLLRGRKSVEGWLGNAVVCTAVAAAFVLLLFRGA